MIRLNDTACHCWVCGLKGKSVSFIIKQFKPDRLEEYAKKFLTDTEYRNFLNFGDNTLESLEEEASVKPTLPEDFVLLAALKNLEDSGKKIPKDFADCLRYLESRGITQELMWRFKVGVSGFSDFSQRIDFRRQIIFPSFDSEGELNFIVCRRIDDSKYKYINHGDKPSTIVFDEISIDYNKTVHIFEGPFDLMKANMNATILLGSSLSPNAELYKKLLKNAKNVVLCLDPDALEKSIRIFKLLAKAGLNVTCAEFPPERDPGSLTRQEILACISRAKEIQWRDDIIHKIAKIRTSSFL